MAESDVQTFGVVITAKEMYDLMLETKLAVTRIEGQVREMVRTVDEHEGKIDDLTKKYYMAGGIGGVTGAVLTSVIPLLVKVFGG